MPAFFDLAVIGAGPAGAATALALCRLGGMRVALCEADRFGRHRVGESIPPDTRLLLADIGLWDAFVAEGHDPCHGSCASWGSSELGYNDFLFNPYGHGWHLDRRRFDLWLARAAQAAGACLHTGRIDTIEPLADGRIRLRAADRDGPGIEARFVVDATGQRARIARQLGATRLVQDRLTFLYGFFPPGSARCASSLTTLEAVADGWWYGARLPDGRVVAALAGDPVVADAGRLHSADEGLRRHAAVDQRTRRGAWLEQLAATRHVRALIETGLTPDGPLIACEALSARLDHAAGHAWLAVGDAASSFDPLTAQGIHKALQDGLNAAHAIRAWFSGDPDPVAAYANGIQKRFDDYLVNRESFYAAERRWWDWPFWIRRRRSAGAPGRY